jgi:hypothetical protein
MLYCPIGIPTEEKLKIFTMDLDDASKSLLEQNSFQGKGSSFHPPFFAFEVGFKQATYDYDYLICNIKDLFDSIDKNKNKISDILLLDGMSAIFAINFDCQSIDQKPAFDLNNEQLKILGEIGASLSLDSYLSW